MTHVVLRIVEVEVINGQLEAPRVAPANGRLS